MSLDLPGEIALAPPAFLLSDTIRLKVSYSNTKALLFLKSIGCSPDYSRQFDGRV
jgi:hypothetical protein